MYDIYMYIYIYIYTYIYVYTHIYIYIYIYQYMGLAENGVYPCMSQEHGDESSHFQTN